MRTSAIHWFTARNPPPPFRPGPRTFEIASCGRRVVVVLTEVDVIDVVDDAGAVVEVDDVDDEVEVEVDGIDVLVVPFRTVVTVRRAVVGGTTRGRVEGVVVDWRGAVVVVVATEVVVVDDDVVVVGWC